MLERCYPIVPVDRILKERNSRRGEREEKKSKKGQQPYGGSYSMGPLRKGVTNEKAVACRETERYRGEKQADACSQIV